FKASKRPFASGIQDSNVKERQARLHPYASQVLPGSKSYRKLRHTSDLDWIWTSSLPRPRLQTFKLLYRGNTCCSRPRRYLWITLYFQAPPVHTSSTHDGPPSTIQMNNSLCKRDLSNPCRRPTTPRLDFCRHPTAHISHAPRLLPALLCPGDQLLQSDRVRAAC
ncbi:hypothetical protein B0H11DRAFT_1983418, partial [Mycena galericulata]